VQGRLQGGGGDAVRVHDPLLEREHDEHGDSDRQHPFDPDSQGPGEALEAAAKGRPIGRLAEVEEIASAIVFLCSENASYVSGSAWSVDGGTVQVII